MRQLLLNLPAYITLFFAVMSLLLWTIEVCTKGGWHLNARQETTLGFRGTTFVLLVIMSMAYSGWRALV